MKFSVVIPAIPKHHKYLPTLIKLLEFESQNICEIFIIASSTSLKEKRDLENVLKKQSKKNKIYLISNLNRQTAGQNRNTGWDLASGEYVMFLDADDYYLEGRTTFLDKVIWETNADIVIHNYHKSIPHLLLRKKKLSNSADWISTEELRKSTWPTGQRNINTELGIKGDTNIIARNNDGKSMPIQHGHVTVRRNISLRFSVEYGEDGRLLRDALESNLIVIYLPDKLSIYNRLTLSFLVKTFYRNSRDKIQSLLQI